MKLKYEFDKDHVQALFRHFGLALTLGAVFHATLENDDVILAVILCLTGVVFAGIGTLKENKHD